jgi:AraC-like DNA-binding protein
MKTNFLNIHDVVLLLTSLECIFLAALLKLLPSKRIQPRSILASFFMLVALVLTATVVVWNGDLKDAAINHTPYVVAILAGCLLLQGPVLFFYLRSLSKKIHVLRWRNLIHLVPAILVIAIVLGFNLNSVDWQPSTPVDGAEKFARSLAWAMVKFLPFVYIIASVWAEYKLREDLKQVYSSISSTELKLADVVLFGFGVHWLWSVLAYALEGYVNPSISDQLGIFDNYLTVALVNGLFVFGLINTRQLINPVVIAPPKPVPEAKLATKVSAIEKGIQEQKLFLESNINLERFAEQIGLRPRDVSAVLKLHYQSNFFEFINGYRVEEAKRLLALPEYKDETILELIFKSGFNSPSAFHRFFKRMVGVTPTEYRKQAIEAARKF